MEHMYLTRLQLTNFRNYGGWEHEFTSPATVLVGPNAVGKTNILEAVYLLATGISFRAGKIEEMVKWEEEVAHVTGEVVTSPEITNNKIQISNKTQITNFNDQKHEELRVTLTRGMVQGKKVQKRRYIVNGVPRRRLDFVGHLPAVKFIPQDLELISGSPSHRRDYLDDVLVQVDREYRRSLLSYSKGLTRRNRLLWLVREGKTQASSLLFWNRLLCKEGEILTTKRQGLVDFINATSALGLSMQLHYTRSVVTEERLLQYEQRELGAGHTLVGPHKDDFVVMSHEKRTVDIGMGRDLAIYGSRGEQRMAVLWLKLAEMAFVEKSMGVGPLLLLDDIFSELDQEHDKLVMGLMTRQQTIVTTTEADVKLTKLADVELKSLAV